jgi:low temperature requirement protein LtrA
MSENRKNFWWGSPRDFTKRPDERKVSWLELFYDLVYVAAVSQMTGQFAEHLNWAGLGQFLFLFALVFWSWLNGSLYHDLHSGENLRTRYLTLVQMTTVVAVAISINDLSENHHQTFAVSFAVLKAVILYLWLAVGFYDAAYKTVNRFYVINYGIGLTLFAASALTDFTTAKILWTLALLSNYSATFFSASATLENFENRGEVFSISATMMERYGLFTILVLGEMVLGVVHGAAEIREKTAAIWAASMLGILIAFLLWWISFDLLADRRTKKGYWYFAFLTFTALPILAGIAAAGSTMRVIIEETGTHHEIAAKPIFCLAVAAILFAVVIVSRLISEAGTNAKSYKKIPATLVAAGIANVIIALFANHLNTIPLFALVIILLLIPVLIETRVWLILKISDNQANDE